jgi:MFS family permease
MVQFSFSTVGVKLGDKLGPRYSNIIGLIIIYISLGMMAIFTNYYVILISMGIFGMGDGLETLSVIKNCWKYFPEHTGLVNGIILTGLGISSGILTPIADYIIINPDKIEPIDSIYPDFIANRLINYIYFLIILFVILGLIAILFTFKYEKEPNSPDEIFEKSSSIELNETELLIIKDKKVFALCYVKDFFQKKISSFYYSVFAVHVNIYTFKYFFI